jgi:hypothetical protein
MLVDFQRTTQRYVPDEVHRLQSLAHSAVARLQGDAISMNTVGSQQGVFSPRFSNAALQFFHDVFEEVGSVEPISVFFKAGSSRTLTPPDLSTCHYLL